MNTKHEPTVTYIPTIGAAIGATASIEGCEYGPTCIQNSAFNDTLTHALKWQEIVHFTTPPQKNDIAKVKQFSSQLATQTGLACAHKTPFLVIGGDHSCAIGTWSGVSYALKNEGPIGLIWIDAHFDAHTHQTSHTGNIHGMPVAALLGHGDPSLTKIKSLVPALDHQNIVMIGMSSYEAEEKALLLSLGVKIYENNQVHSIGFKQILNDSIAYLSAKTDHIGISLDLDALNVADIPAVGTPAANGIPLKSALSAFKTMPKSKLICTEIAEFNPSLDKNHKTEKAIFAIINSIY